MMHTQNKESKYFEKDAIKQLPKPNFKYSDTFIYLLKVSPTSSQEFQETGTWTTETQLRFYDFFDLWFRKQGDQPAIDIEDELEPSFREEDVLFSIVRNFFRIEKVESIYVQRYGEELKVKILLSMTHYDDELMNTLLDREYEVRQEHLQVVFDFVYLPISPKQSGSIIHPYAKCIYMR